MPLDPILQSKLHYLESITLADIAVNPARVNAALASFHDLDLPYDPPQVETRDETIPGPRGTFRIRIYQPASATTLHPALVWAHGGGFRGGSIDMNEADLVSREICVRVGAVVVSVDYHLANGGDVTYPQLHQEVAEAWRWMSAHCEDLGVERTRIALGGASAGGSLVIAATRALRSHGEVLPARLVLAYPVTYRTLVSTPESEDLLSTLPSLLRFSKEMHDAMFQVYLAAQTDTPFAATNDGDFSGFPPILMIVSEYDDLRPGAEAFAEQARANGIAVERYLARGVLHGHLNFTPALPEMDATIQKIADVVGA